MPCLRAVFLAFALALAGLALVYPGFAVSAEPSAASERLAVLVEEVREDFPQVQHISVDRLKSEFSGAVLIDVRDREEFEISHLPGAIHAQGAKDIDAVAKAHPQKTLVFYCTVGVRSAIAAQGFLARRAARKDFSPAMDKPLAVNLAGSIFAWANAGELLENEAGLTRDVHPYSAWWGLRYLDDGSAHQF